MEKEIERSRESQKALNVVPARAAELETKVLRLQHDLISTMSDSEEADQRKGKKNEGRQKERIKKGEISLQVCIVICIFTCYCSIV
jgi:tropomyosin-2